MNGSWQKAIFVGLAMLVVGSVAYQAMQPAPKPLKIPPSKTPDPAGSSNAAANAPRPGVELTATALPHVSQRGGFRSSESCRGCHADQYDSWHGSYHRTMTQVASPSTVIAPFDNIRLQSRGRQCYLTREGDKFFVTMADPDWEAGAQANGLNLDRVEPPIVKREIVMTTGSHHMQGYWVPSTVPNMLRQMPFVYLKNDQRWVPREDIFIAPPDAERHLAVWNDNCLVCHAVAGNPNFDLQQIKVATEVAELGISCEACHGPGEAHIAFHTPGMLNKPATDPVINPGKCDSRISSEICGQCHSYFEPYDMEAFAKHGYTYRAGGKLSDSHNLVSYAQAKERGNETAMGSYWSDGTGRLAGREYSAMMESPCFQRGQLSCVSCHSSHSSDPNDQLAKEMHTNQACVQCHPQYSQPEALAQHTHHAADSAASLCYNCHMPHTSFGVMKAMRSHRVQSPRIVTGTRSDHPNACNLCHLDQTMAWSAEKLNQWYSQPIPELTADEQQIAAGVLWMIKGDAVQRAIASWHNQWPEALKAAGTAWQQPFLAQLLMDDYALVRYLAGQALGGTAFREQSQWSTRQFDYIAPADDRQRISRQVTQLWAQAVRVPEDTPAERERLKRLLMDPESGQVDELALKRLWQTQNKRVVFLPE